MTTKTYKRYTIRIVGLSHTIFRPGAEHSGKSSGYAQSMAGARRWINADLDFLAFRDKHAEEIGRPHDRQTA